MLMLRMLVLSVLYIISASSFATYKGESFIINHPSATKTATTTASTTQRQRKLKFHNWNSELNTMSQNEQCTMGGSTNSVATSGSEYAIKSDEDDNTEIGRARFETKIEGNVLFT